MKPLETKQKFIELRAKGYSYDSISKELGVAKSTLVEWAKEFETEIANLYAMELTAIYEQYFVAKRSRIVAFGTVVEKLMDGFDKLDFNLVPIEKRLELLAKYLLLLKEEGEQLLFKKEVALEDVFQSMNVTEVKWKA
ncbi:helix-turn-helix domain-containing protein [Neobacillus sp. 3P2-tot-E-2]|uniref:helix-turn-helix domain-containing protein n=1 Tax=Neobacillus sp. 3P2-tot-E-2 TaxID=3132212 RepID=UPI0039A35DB3